jgi:peptide chain release factor
MEKIIQITSGQGPVETERVVALVYSKMLAGAKMLNYETKVIESVDGSLSGTLFSVLFLLKGQDLTNFCEAWQGTIQWIAQSPYRTLHKRKNWFVGVTVYDVPAATIIDEKQIVYQTMRASGPGGQNVNKVETAVRATHLPSGISVTASVHRSQMLNKKEAFEKLKAKLMSWQIAQANQQIKEKWMEHNTLERGNAVKVFQERL